MSATRAGSHSQRLGAGAPRLALWVAAAAAVIAYAPRAQAHQVGLSSGDYAVADGELRMALTFARNDVAAAIPEVDADHDGTVTAAEVADERTALGRALAAGIVVRSGPETADPGAAITVESAAVEGDAVVAHATAHLPKGAPRIGLRLDLLDRLPFGHRHVAHVTSASGSSDTVLYRDHRSIEIATGAPAVASEAPASTDRGRFAALFRMGVEHILTGYDHLLFLFGIVLVGGRLRSLALAISAFTLAHSVTLALAALGIWAPSPRLVEPAIALSIAYVGFENYFVRDASKRWRITMPFGLIHGFGFAGALREIGLARAEVPAALLSFNLGVEVGQLAIVAATVPLIWWARRAPRFETTGVRALNAAVAAAGLVWFVLRLASLRA